MTEGLAGLTEGLAGLFEELAGMTEGLAGLVESLVGLFEEQEGRIEGLEGSAGMPSARTALAAPARASSSWLGRQWAPARRALRLIPHTTPERSVRSLFTSLSAACRFSRTPTSGRASSPAEKARTAMSMGWRNCTPCCAAVKSCPHTHSSKEAASVVTRSIGTGTPRRSTVERACEAYPSSANRSAR